METSCRPRPPRWHDFCTTDARVTAEDESSADDLLVERHQRTSNNNNNNSIVSRVVNSTSVVVLTPSSRVVSRSRNDLVSSTADYVSAVMKSQQNRKTNNGTTMRRTKSKLDVDPNRRFTENEIIDSDDITARPTCEHLSEVKCFASSFCTGNCRLSHPVARSRRSQSMPASRSSDDLQGVSSISLRHDLHIRCTRWLQDVDEARKARPDLFAGRGRAQNDARRSTSSAQFGSNTRFDARHDARPNSPKLFFSLSNPECLRTMRSSGSFNKF